MAMNPMQKKARTSFLLGMLLTLIVTGIIIALLIAQLANTKKQDETITYRTVYVISQNVNSGETIDGMMTMQEVRSEYVPNNAITSASQFSENSTAKINLKKGTVLTTDMINEDGIGVTPDIRLQEYNMIVLPTQLEEGETIDVRLRLPSGVDFIVLSGKYVEQTDSGTIWIKVSEEEILTMSNAIVEAYIMEGSYLYATTYVDPGMQNSSIPTYIASQEVINLMYANPNITNEAINAIAARYTENARNQRNSINSSLNEYTEERTQNIEESTQEEIEKMQSARQQYVDGLGA